MDLNFQVKNLTIGIIGLGYVGLPLALEFGKRYKTIGYDLNDNRIAELKSGTDRTKEVERDDFRQANKLEFTNDQNCLKNAEVYIVTVPTPINDNKTPDLKYLKNACELIAGSLKIGDIVVFESTVYPGCTEEFCVPIIEERSGLKYKVDFDCGYSPERINPGDKTRRLSNIIKVISASSKRSTEILEILYSSVVSAGIHVAPSIKVAEAAKVIENIQRDVNIALVNELAMLFERIGINTKDVLTAAGTKWNFLPFEPGLVGGHCIGVDPYYLTSKAEELGFQAEMILSGRRTNERMSQFIFEKILKEIIQRKLEISTLKVAILGITFKENCPDTRNSKVVDLIQLFQNVGLHVDVYDPLANEEEVFNQYNINLKNINSSDTYDVVIYCVPHEYFVQNETRIFSIVRSTGFIFDIKSTINKMQDLADIITL